MDELWRPAKIEPETVEINGNGHHDKAGEPQQSLFSWAEFMAEQELWTLPHFLSHNAKPAASSRRCLRLIRLSSLLPVYPAAMGDQWMSLTAV